METSRVFIVAIGVERGFKTYSNATPSYLS